MSLVPISSQLIVGLVSYGVEAAQSSSQQPLIYLLSPNRMIDNDYHLPSYLPHGDTVFIPGAAASDLPDEVRDFLGIEAQIEASEKTVTDEIKENGQGRLEGGPSGLSESAKLEEGWVETPMATGPPEDGEWKLLAMDCEMVSPSPLSADLYCAEYT